MSKTKVTLIIIGCILAAIVAIGLLGAAFIWTAKDVPVSDSDRALVVRAQDFADISGTFTPLQSAEILTKSRYIDGTESIDYEYAAEGDDHPFIAVTITYDRKKSDALATYALDWQSSKMGLGLGDSSITIKEDNSVYKVGDKSRLGHIVIDGMTLGYLLVVLKDKITYTMMVSNYTIDTPETWQKLFDHRIANLGKLSIKPVEQDPKGK